MRIAEVRVWEAGNGQEGRVQRIEGLGRVLLSEKASGPVIGGLDESVRVDVLGTEEGKVAFSVYHLR